MTAALARQRWWVMRLLVLPLHVLAFAVAAFFLVRLIPGDPVQTLSGGQPLSAEDYAALRTALGLDGSLLTQLFSYLGELVRLDFGQSLINGTDVLSEIGSRLPPTVELAVLAMLASVVVTLVVGYAVSLHPGNPLSAAVRWYARAAGAIPDFVLGVAGIFLFYAVLRWVPAPIGRYDPLLNPAPRVTGFPLVDAALSSDTALLASMLHHLVLPLAVLTLAYAPMLLKLFLRALDESIDAAPTRFRIASGCSRRWVLLSVYRRALPATVAMGGTVFGFLLGGAVVIEQLFGIPGLGQYAVVAVSRADLVSLQGFLVIVAALSLFVFFLVDITTMVLDPRRRPGVSEGAAA